MVTVWNQPNTSNLNQVLRKKLRYWLLGFLFLTINAGLGIPSLLANTSIEAKDVSSLEGLEESIWLAEANQLDQLESKAVRLLQNDSNSAFAHYLVAELYLKQFKQNPSQLRWLKQASELGQQAIELSPQEDFGYLIAAQVLDLMGYTENALSVLEGDKDQPLNLSWRVNFLKGQLQSGQVPESDIIDLFASGLQSSTKARNILTPYIVALLQSSLNGQTLIRELQKWELHYPHRLFKLSLAMAFSSNLQFGEAHKLYFNLQREQPSFSEAYINDAIILYSHLNQPKLALTLLRRTLESSVATSEDQKILVKSHMAKIHLQFKGNSGESKPLFIEAIVKANNPAELLSFALEAYQKSNRLNEFVILLEDLRPLLPGSSFLFALEGEILSEKLSRHEQAIESFHSAIILEPERSDFYNGMGLVYYRMHQLDKALATFHKAAKLDPQDATSRYNEACVLAILGRSKEALGLLQAAIGLDPRLQQTALLDKDFTSIRVTEQFKHITTQPGSQALSH